MEERAKRNGQREPEACAHLCGSPPKLWVLIALLFNLSKEYVGEESTTSQVVTLSQLYRIHKHFSKYTDFFFSNCKSSVSHHCSTNYSKKLCSLALLIWLTARPKQSVNEPAIIAVLPLPAPLTSKYLHQMLRLLVLSGQKFHKHIEAVNWEIIFKNVKIESSVKEVSSKPRQAAPPIDKPFRMQALEGSCSLPLTSGK